MNTAISCRVTFAVGQNIGWPLAFTPQPVVIPRAYISSTYA